MKKAAEDQTISIQAPDLRVVTVRVIGTAPLLIHKFSSKTVGVIVAKQEAGSTSKKGKKRDPKNFDEAFELARHISTDGWDGIHAAAFRNAMISACRLVGYKMTMAKLSVFILADGQDNSEQTPLVRIIGGDPERYTIAARNATGVVDIRTRPMWREWQADIRAQYDADQFTSTDVVNLLARAGAQVGVGEGRPDSKNSAGLGFGTFRLAEEGEEIARVAA